VALLPSPLAAGRLDSSDCIATAPRHCLGCAIVVGMANLPSDTELDVSTTLAKKLTMMLLALV
jgi:hypothetical protein